MKEKHSENWGGKRPNSGRPKGEIVYKNITISGAEKEINSIKEQAWEDGKSISRFVIEKIVPEELRSK